MQAGPLQPDTARLPVPEPDVLMVGRDTLAVPEAVPGLAGPTVFTEKVCNCAF